VKQGVQRRVDSRVETGPLPLQVNLLEVGDSNNLVLAPRRNGALGSFTISKELEPV
jgi:hypothetical protein